MRAAGQQWGGRGRRRQQGTAASPDARTYHNQTTGKPFSWAVAGDVMLPVVVRLRACQERRMELFEVVRANPGDASLRAQFDQATYEVVVVAAELRDLEAQWGFLARSPPLAAFFDTLQTLFIGYILP
jgi:hypothetical protein